MNRPAFERLSRAFDVACGVQSWAAQMSSLANDSSLAARVKAFETALAERGRSDLLPPLSLVRALLERAPDAPRSIQLATQALGEVRACVNQRGRKVSDGLLVDLEGELDALDEDGADADLLEGFANAADDDLAVFADAIRAIERAAPKDSLGTLREPLAKNAVPRSNEAARVLMKGELHPGLLADLIQLFAQNGETGLLFIEGTHDAASVYFKDGVITDAACAGDSGEKAFFRAMHIREGRFSYQRGVEAETTRIFRSAQHLIMDTLRMIDEAS